MRTSIFHVVSDQPGSGPADGGDRKRVSRLLAQVLKQPPHHVATYPPECIWAQPRGAAGRQNARSASSKRDKRRENGASHDAERAISRACVDSMADGISAIAPASEIINAQQRYLGSQEPRRVRGSTVPNAPISAGPRLTRLLRDHFHPTIRSPALAGVCEREPPPIPKPTPGLRAASACGSTARAPLFARAGVFSGPPEKDCCR